MAKFLIISSIQIWPPHSGGQQRSANLAEAIAAEGHDVDVYSWSGRKPDYLARKRSSMQTIANSITEFVNRGWLAGSLQWIAYRFDLPPLWVTLLAKHFVPKRIQVACREADVVVIDFPFLYPCLHLAKGRKVLNSHNVEWKLWQQRHRRSWLANWVRRIETKALSAVEVLWGCSDEDMEDLLRLSKQADRIQKRVVPNGIDLRLFQPRDELRSKLRHELRLEDSDFVVLFSASNYPPNHEGLQFLKRFEEQNRQALEELGVKIVVLGSVCKERVAEGNLRSTGFVASFEPWFQIADTAINPIFSGSGTNVKLAQYIAAELPILSTGFGLRGYALKDGEHAVVFDANSLLDGLVRIRSNPEFARKLAQNALDANVDHISMRSSVKQALLALELDS